MSCIECGDSSKYKCPICNQPYCSVSCCKKHKQTPCSAPPPPENSILQQEPSCYGFPTEDTVPQEKLKLLDQSSELKECLRNPYVREILELLDKSPHPDELIQEYMQEPIFTEFVDACLKVVQSENSDINN